MHGESGGHRTGKRQVRAWRRTHCPPSSGQNNWWDARDAKPAAPATGHFKQVPLGPQKLAHSFTNAAIRCKPVRLRCRSSTSTTMHAFQHYVEPQRFSRNCPLTWLVDRKVSFKQSSLQRSLLSNPLKALPHRCDSFLVQPRCLSIVMYRERSTQSRNKHELYEQR